MLKNLHFQVHIFSDEHFLKEKTTRVILDVHLNFILEEYWDFFQTKFIILQTKIYKYVVFRSCFNL